jgi:hypothetical protein
MGVFASLPSSRDPFRMTCEEVQDKLSALLHHEVSNAAGRDMLDHTQSCAACREELEQTRAISMAIRQCVPAEPSARERRRLENRIMNSIGRPPGAAGTSAKPPALPGLPSVQEPRLLAPPPEPPLLSWSGSPHSLPAPQVGASSSSGSLPMSFEEPRSTPLPSAYMTPRPESSRRMLAPERTRFAVWAGLFCWMFLGLMVLGAGLMAVLYMPAQTRKSVPELPSRVQRVAAARWNERRLARARGNYAETFLIRGSVKLNEAVSEASIAHVLPHFVPVTGEMCLVLYREDDLKRLQESPIKANTELLASIRATPELTVKENACQLPLDLVDKFIGIENRATLLIFKDRIEIWSATRLEKYLSTQPRFDLVGVEIQGVNGLPDDQ